MTIEFDLSDEQRQVVQAIEDVLSDRFPVARLRDRRGGQDRTALDHAFTLGWPALAIAEDHGGAGLSLVEDVQLYRAAGRHLVTPTLMASSLAAHLALACGDSGLAAAILGGEKRVCLANVLSGGAPDQAARTLALYDAEGADFCLYWTADRITCLAIADLGAPQDARCIDRTVSLRHASLVPAETQSLAGDAAQSLRRRADLLLAAQLLGLAEGALDLAVDYAKIRQQFGQPIGAFQAIKHRCADMKVRNKVLGALVAMAALSERSGRDDAVAQIAAARLLASRYAIENAAGGIQIHGAMGFTAECDAHLYLLRGHLLENVGSGAPDREVEMASLPLGAAQTERSSSS